jgi:cyclic beta-1,2-glucan synthetase
MQNINMQVTPSRISERVNLEIGVQPGQLGQQLAQNSSVDKTPKNKAILLQHLHSWEKTLHNAYGYFKAGVSKDLAFSRASEWMLDNFYIVEQTLHQIEEDLPQSFYEQLPKLDKTALKGLPRIFGLAWEWVGYCQSQLEITQTAIFVQDYQEVTPLTIGELWALPTMLRIGILERLAAVVTAITEIAAPESLNALPFLPVPPVLASENIVANCFLSLRLLSATDWKAFFEQTSRVEQILRNDPAEIYAGMDFDTRNSYRSVIEELARHSDQSEEAVAQAVIGCCHNPQGTSQTRKTHAGYYLVDAGRSALEKKINYQPGPNAHLRGWFLARPTASYLGSISLISLWMIIGLLAYTHLAGGSFAQLILVGVLGLGLALEAAITLVHWQITHRITPRSLPRMDFSEGIPAGYRTMVVVPTLLANADELDSLLQGLEIYYLSNPDPQLSFALLTDFTDAPAQIMPQDAQLLSLAKTGVERLNQKYAQAAPFYLFHRPRDWNPSEGVWMGWERKRGKLAEFNQLLLNTEPTSPVKSTGYITQVGDLSILPDIKYVITLDADTSLPHGSASRLIATLAHPLNQAVFAADGRTVMAGYTVLQPRVAIKPTSANRSLFSQIFAGNAGFDLYTLAVSDVYQDLFGEGSYVGKGIYDVAAFERSLIGQVRENTLLSHDLFEGIYGRAALVTDIILYEEYPARYPIYTRRLRRWIRGDWQLLPWLMPIVRTKTGYAPNRLSIINRWKIFDNLRRSLLLPTMLAFFTAAWLVLPGSPLVWTLLILLPSFWPILAQTLQHMNQNIGRLSLKELARPVKLPLMRWGLAILFLPYEALLILGAIRTTLARLLISRKKLLQWTTAAHTALSLRLNARSEPWLEMVVSLVFTALLGSAVAIFNPTALTAAAPLLIAWLIAPQVAYWISRPITHTSAPLNESQSKEIQRLARRTWAFFEHFAGPDDHWLPPDHYQESPRGNVAHYTTPTNIGLFLLSTLSAYDLGYVDLFELVVRLRSTFENIDKLEHYRGHLLNWYDTQTLASLSPRYISTVDSGNLAACLITLKQGLLALTEAPILGKQQWQGLLVILDILKNTLQHLKHELEKDNPGSAILSFEVELDNIYERVTEIQDKPEAWTMILTWLSSEGWETVSRRLMELLESHPNLNLETLGELQLFLDMLHHHLQTMRRNIGLFAPWLSRLDSPPVMFVENPAAQAWQGFKDDLPGELPTLGQAAAVFEHIRNALRQFQAQLQLMPALWSNEAVRDWCQTLDEDLSSARMTVTPMLIGFRDLAEQAKAVVLGMDFHFLFDERRQVFHIGYNAAREKLDDSYYDLLASEARIASLVAIAKGDVPQSHWLHLGRPVTKVNGKQVLLSWSGTMFEYLMPVLFTKIFEGTFLFDSCFAALDAQIGYGHENHVPWGVSESGYFAMDASQNYQYRAFGIPDLGYKRDLPDNLVVAPYASMLGLSLQPQMVLNNLTRLQDLNMLGRFGLYEAIDYTQARLHLNQKYAIVQSYMAHHQGMILLAACNSLMQNVMIRRFHADERIQSIELLLQEKIPQNPHIEYPHPDEPLDLPLAKRSVNSAAWRVPADSPIPQVHVLSQGDYHLLITNAGSGYSQWREFALTRWQADSTLDDWGTWIYLQDRENGELWSATCQPSGCNPENQEVLFSPQKVEFRRWDHGISLHTEITVGLDGIEFRRVTLLNDSDRPRKLKLTSYGEVVLASQATDRRHPAFNKLFIESEYVSGANALLFQRRPRSADEKPVVLAHALVVEPGRKVTGEYESDRAKFLGRGQTQRFPAALQNRVQHLSGTVGGTLDPIFSLAQEIDLKPHTKTRITFLTLAASSRADALDLLSQYPTTQSINRAFDEARTHSERELTELGLNAYNVEHIQQLLSALLYPSEILRAAPHLLAKNETGLSGLWGHGISGDFPILLVHITDGDSALLTEALQAQAYWRNRHIKVNLVILNDQDTGYALDLHNIIYRKIVRLGAEGWLNQRDGIFLLRTDQLQEADQSLLETVAGVILDEKIGTFADHDNRFTEQPIRLPRFTPALSLARDLEATPELVRPTDLLMDNGLGGFNPDGKEYVIYLQPGQHTPRPWVNVIANPQFGFLVSEAGAGCTWAENSGENRLTPWRNDPLTDLPGEALYLRDEETGLVWSPTPMPAGGETACLIRHGAGYTTFETQSHGLSQHLRLFAVSDAPVKIVRLRLENLWTRPRRITATYYAEWVLGTTRQQNQAYIVPEFDPATHALLASNRFNTGFGERVAFLAANKKPHGVTADRTEFLGRMGSLQAPAALKRIGLASKVNAGLDPCAAIQLHVDLAPGQVEEILFFIGEGANRAESLALINSIQAQGQVEAAWQAVQTLWDDILGTILVQTPNHDMDLLLNRWLLYQTLSCRLWGRTALYQSGGAFGFRDQLQDVLALFHTRPDLARQHILNAAQHQFEAGDVLHWWNPPSGRGVRTRFTDDMLWLPYVTAEYVAATGDGAILNVKIPFLKGEPLRPGEAERYAEYEATSDLYTLYEHCRRAIEKGTTSGPHELPLIGAGDWNDGMNRVGIAGRGESVWLGWFLYSTLVRFSALCLLMNDDPEPYQQQAERLAQALESHAWDGNWYLRAFYDDGSPLGSSQNNECRIDSIAQSWAVLSGAADPARAAQAMESVNNLLVRPTEQIILLFTPPFNKTPLDPGYIKGYLRGVRENGGQYTHAAIWAVRAFAELGQGDRAEALFRMLNPIGHADTPGKVARYKVEPYVIPADIYSQPPLSGNGGWTWYTGSSGWMYSLGIEAILGISRLGSILKINPCIPRHWPGFTLDYRFGNTHYLVNVQNPDGVNRGIRQVLLDGNPLPDNLIPLVDDGKRHEVQVLMATAAARKVSISTAMVKDNYEKA